MPVVVNEIVQTDAPGMSLWRKRLFLSTAHIAAFPAPPDIGVQIYNRGTMSTMFSKLQSGQSIPQVISWAQGELEGFVR